MCAGLLMHQVLRGSGKPNKHGSFKDTETEILQQMDCKYTNIYDSYWWQQQMDCKYANIYDSYWWQQNWYFYVWDSGRSQ